MSVDAKLLRAVELAVDSGAAILREKRWHVGSVIPKGDRDYATEAGHGSERSRPFGGSGGLGPRGRR